MTRTLLFAATALLVVAPLQAADKPAVAEGTWLLKVISGTIELPYGIVKVEMKDGKPVGSLVAENPGLQGALKLTGLTVDGGKVEAIFDIRGSRNTFEGVVNAKNPKEILGTFGDDRRVTRAVLAVTDKTEIGANDRGTVELPEPMRQAQQLSSRVVLLGNQVRTERDADKKAELQKQLEEARKKAETEVPALYREVLAKHADHMAAGDAAMALLRSATTSKAKADDVADWAKAAESSAEAFGPRALADARTQVAEILASQKDYGPTALAFAEKVVAALGKDAPPAAQSRALKVLRAAQTSAGKTDAAKETAAKLEKIEELLDAEYHKTVPPFKPEKYAGRKDKANQVAVMELFTGAQCPPCVAADAAFDGLMKAYEPKDLVLIQYHMHIPGPDPMTNPDTQARWDYYSKLFPGQVRGVPSSLFNGQVKAGGGGGMPQAQAKFNQYKEIIDATLDKSTAVLVTGSAVQQGDTVTIDVALDGVKDSKDDLKLRLLLVEESIRYVGGNGIRFHHQVVRSMPGGPEGAAVKDLKDGKHTAKVDLAELKKNLTKYLTDFEAGGRSFANPDKPLDLKNLRVIAMVQDDKTGEILQAAQFDVGGTK